MPPSNNRLPSNTPRLLFEEVRHIITYYILKQWIKCFHSRGQHLCKFIGTKESVCIRKEFNSHRTGLGHQHGRRDVTWKHSIVFFKRSDWLLNQWTSSAIHWFTSSSFRASDAKLAKVTSKMASQFAAVTNKEISQKSNKLFPKYTKKVKNIGLEVLIGKALSVWLDFIDETGKKGFCSQMQIKSCVTLFSWYVHK